MTDFNALPLAEQLKQLQPGDELHLRGGGWLPFVKYDYPSKYIVSHHYAWFPIGGINPNGCHSTDIIRVARPTERKVPEVVEFLRRFKEDLQPNKYITTQTLRLLVLKLADHFEKETP